MKYSKSDILELLDMLTEEMYYEFNDFLDNKQFLQADGYHEAIRYVKKFRVLCEDL